MSRFMYRKFRKFFEISIDYIKLKMFRAALIHSALLRMFCVHSRSILRNDKFFKGSPVFKKVAILRGPKKIR